VNVDAIANAVAHKLSAKRKKVAPKASPRELQLARKLGLRR
jgi:hypothetical protein